MHSCGTENEPKCRADISFTIVIGCHHDGMYYNNSRIRINNDYSSYVAFWKQQPNDVETHHWWYKCVYAKRFEYHKIRE
jgi:hypothetical protein